jgi:aminoglycoside 2''-phosphotransferase
MRATDHDEDQIGALRVEIARVAAELKRESVASLGEGMDSLAVLVGDAFVFRFAKHAGAATGLRREIALLPHLAPRLPLDVPRFEYVGDHSVTGLPFVGYRLIRGEPLHRPLFDDLSERPRNGVLADLAAFLDDLHAFPVEEALRCGITAGASRAAYIEDLRSARAHVFPLLDPATRRRVASRLEAFLADDANFAFTPSLLHADLWPEHVLFSRGDGRLAGVIDFGDVSIGDPDYDLAFLAARLGPDFIAGLLRYDPRADPARLAEKSRSFALFNAIDDVFIGLERDDRALVDSALAELAGSCSAAAWSG